MWQKVLGITTTELTHVPWEILSLALVTNGPAIEIYAMYSIIERQSIPQLPKERDWSLESFKWGWCWHISPVVYYVNICDTFYYDILIKRLPNSGFARYDFQNCRISFSVWMHHRNLVQYHRWGSRRNTNIEFCPLCVSARYCILFLWSSVHGELIVQPTFSLSRTVNPVDLSPTPTRDQVFDSGSLAFLYLPFY